MGTVCDIDGWIRLVDKVKDLFPGLETEDAVAEHRKTVIDFMEKDSALCAEDNDNVVGVLLFSREEAQICFLAVDKEYRRQHIAENMVKYAINLMPKDKNVTVTTYCEDDPNGSAARNFYKDFGFEEGELKEEFGSPVQEFVLKRCSSSKREDFYGITVREYRLSDCKRITELFYDTVHKVNIKDYTEEQIEAWAGTIPNAEDWDRSFQEHITGVAVKCGEIVGFGDIDKFGYIDRLYVDSLHQNEGVGKKLCDWLENKIDVRKYTVFASITAKGFFEKRGYKVVKENYVNRCGIILKNYFMYKISE